LPLGLEGSFQAYRVPAPAPKSLLERILAVFSGCGR
jgi:hypothetical protein